MRSLIPLSVFVLMLIFLGIGLKLNPREIPSPLIGKPTPAFDLETLESPALRITPGLFKGQVSLVNVWASWCTSCRQEHPVLMALSQDRGIPIYGLNYKDKRETGLQWLRQHGNPYRKTAFDPEGRTGIDWGVYGVPETFVIDKKGIIRHKKTGPLTPAVVDRELMPLIQALQMEP